MTRRVRISSADLWASFMGELLGLIPVALAEVASQGTFRGKHKAQEWLINRYLYFAIVRATAKRQRQIRSDPDAHGSSSIFINMPVVVPEAQNRPSPDERVDLDGLADIGEAKGVAREGKRPDFQWTICDDQAEDENASALTFVAECKRLRHPAPRWAFNENYVTRGAVRFVSADHLYGRDDLEGAMIGYIQALDVDAISAEVAEHLAQAGLPDLPRPAPVVNARDVYAADHTLHRVGGPKSPFRLHHIWVDLRAGA